MNLAQGGATSFKLQLNLERTKVTNLEKEKYLVEKDVKNYKKDLERESSKRDEMVRTARDEKAKKVKDERKRAEELKE